MVSETRVSWLEELSLPRNLHADFESFSLHLCIASDPRPHCVGLSALWSFRVSWRGSWQSVYSINTSFHWMFPVLRGGDLYCAPRPGTNGLWTGCVANTRSLSSQGCVPSGLLLSDYLLSFSLFLSSASSMGKTQNVPNRSSCWSWV